MKNSIFVGSIDENFNDFVKYASENEVTYLFGGIKGNEHYQLDTESIVENIDDLSDKFVILGREIKDSDINVVGNFEYINSLCKYKDNIKNSIETEATIFGGYLFATIHAPALESIDRIEFLLFKDGKFVKTFKEKDFRFSIKLQETGIYYINGIIYSGNQKFKCMSKMYEYVSESTKKELHRFLASEENCRFKKAKYYENKYPYTDFIVTNLSGKIRNDFLNEFNLGVYNTSQTNFKFISRTDMKRIANGKVCLSGGIKVRDELIVGEEDINENKMCEDFIDSIGGYTAVIDTNDSLIITSDYFSTGKIYYFVHDDKFVCSNRYHLLLIFLAQSGIKCKLDLKNIISYLGNSDFIWGEQPSNNGMAMSNTYCLDFYKNIKISNGNISFIDGKIRDIYSINTNQIISNEEYVCEIKKVKQDLYDNISAAMKNKRYSKIICDLSGGIDSRLMFGTIVNIPNADEHVFIRTEPFPDKDDFDVATTLADAFGYGYDFLLTYISKHSEFTDRYSMNELLNLTTSLEMGIYFGQTNFLKPVTIRPDYMELWGTNGEAVTRPYITYDKFSDEFSEKDEEEWCDDIIRNLCRLSTAGYLQVNKFLKQNMEKQLKEMPFTDITHNYEMFYLIYRNRYHCDASKGGGYWVYQYQPLQSETSLKLFHKVFEQHKSFKYVFDLQYINNPMMTIFRYAKDSYNESWENLRNEMVVRHSISVPISQRSQCYEENKIKFDIRQENQCYNLEYKINAEEFKNIKNINIVLCKSLLPYFKKLMMYQDGVFIELIGYSYWHILKMILEGNNAWIDNNKFRNIYKKVRSLASMINIFENV